MSSLFKWNCEIFSNIIRENSTDRDFCRAMIEALIENHGKQKVFLEIAEAISLAGFLQEDFETPENEQQLNEQEEL